jgi:metal-responsive CopG/Arc/MetJ family transcriptional regulator
VFLNLANENLIDELRSMLIKTHGFKLPPEIMDEAVSSVALWVLEEQQKGLKPRSELIADALKKTVKRIRNETRYATRSLDAPTKGKTGKSLSEFVPAPTPDTTPKSAERKKTESLFENAREQLSFEEKKFLKALLDPTSEGKRKSRAQLVRELETTTSNIDHKTMQITRKLALLSSSSDAETSLLQQKVKKITEEYERIGISLDKVLEKPFLLLATPENIRKTQIYLDHGATRAQISKVVLRFPPFAGYNHERVLNDLTKTYGVTRAQISKVILTHPQFAGLNHERVFSDLRKSYGFSRAQISKVVLSFPPFAWYNHERVLSGLTKVYGFSRSQISKVVLRFPPFAGLNHERVLRQTTRIGKVVGLSREQIIQTILENPLLAGYSRRRNLATSVALKNVFEQTGYAKGLTKEEAATRALELYKKTSSLSPYPVGGSKETEDYWKRHGNPVQSKMGMVITRKIRRMPR